MANVLLKTGLLVGRGKKIKFRGIFRVKFAEKTANFAGISREFSRPVPAEKRLVKNGQFRGASRANFAGKRFVLC